MGIDINKKLTLEKKTFAYFSIALIFVFSIFIMLFTNIYRNNVKNVIIDEMYKNINQTDEYLELMIKNINNSIDIFLINSDMQKRIERINSYDQAGTYPYYSNILGVNSYVKNMKNSIEGIERIQVYLNRRGILVSTDDDVIIEAHEGNYDIYNRFLFEQTTSIRDFSSEGIKIIKPVYAFRTGKIQGYIEVLISSNIISDLMNANQNSRSLIVDNNMNIIVDTSKTFALSRDEKDILFELIDTESVSKSIGRYVYVSTKFVDNSINLVSITQIDKTAINTAKLMQYILMIFIANIIILALFIYVLSQAVFRRLKKLTSAMIKFQEGDFSVSISDENNDDLSYVFIGFNNMVSEMKKLIDELYVERLLQKEAEVKLLYAQINPHFIYNIFDNMNWLLQLKRYGELEYLIESVSDYYKSVLAKGKTFIKVKDIISQLQSYVAIQKVRFSNRFICNFDIDKQLYDITIMNYIIQPLVENSIYHGIEPGTKECNILVSGKVNNKNIIFAVEDDGTGIKKEKLKEIREIIQKNNNGNRDNYYALANINRRIKLYYGEKYGVTISSSYKKGTHVEIIIPRETNGNLLKK